jgi:hypothetical protein
MKKDIELELESLALTTQTQIMSSDNINDSNVAKNMLQSSQSENQLNTNFVNFPNKSKLSKSNESLSPFAQSIMETSRVIRSDKKHSHARMKTTTSPSDIVIKIEKI